MSKTTRLKINGCVLTAKEGYELEKEGDCITISEKPPRYVLSNGRYSQHFKDTITDKAVPLETVLRMLNERKGKEA